MLRGKFILYEIVQLRRPDASGRYSVRDIDFVRQPGPIYRLRAEDGTEVEAVEAEMEATGDSEAPVPYYAIVQFHPHHEVVQHLDGAYGVVEGITLAEDTGRWWLTIATQEGHYYMFGLDEVVMTGYSVPHSVRDLRWATPRPRPNPNKYTPYPVSLADLIRLDGAEADIRGDER